MNNLLENIYTDAYFNNLIIYTIFILYGLLNIYVSKKFAENETEKLFTGLIVSMIFPLVLIIFYVPFQELTAFKEFPEMMTILIIVNGITFLRARTKYKRKQKVKQEILNFTTDLYNSRYIIKKILTEKLANEKEIIENGGTSKYQWDFDTIDKAIENVSGIADHFYKIKNM